MFFFQAEDGIRDYKVTGVQTCALPICLECTFNFATCNNNCIEPVNFAFLQTNGVPAGPPGPQNTTLTTLSGNGRTLKMNPGDRLRVSVSDVPDSGSPDTGGLRASVTDLTTGRTGFIVARPANGFQ